MDEVFSFVGGKPWFLCEDAKFSIPMPKTNLHAWINKHNPFGLFFTFFSNGTVKQADVDENNQTGKQKENEKEEKEGEKEKGEKEGSNKRLRSEEDDDEEEDEGDNEEAEESDKEEQEEDPEEQVGTSDAVCFFFSLIYFSDC